MGKFRWSLVPSEEQSFMILLILFLILMCIYRKKYIQNLIVLHRKIFNRDTADVGLAFMEQTFKSNEYFCWLLLLPGFLLPILLILPVLCGLLSDVELLWNCFFFLVSFFFCIHTKCIIWWNNTATGYIDPAGAQCEHRQAAPEPGMSPARFDEF